MFCNTKSFICCKGMENEKIVDFDSEIIQNLQNDYWTEYLHDLKEAFKIERLDTGEPKKITVSENVLNCLDEWLHVSVTNIKNFEADPCDVILEILRALRNCTSNLLTQNYIIGKTKLLDTSLRFFSRIVEIKNKQLCLKVLMQFMLNLTSSNKQATDKVCAMFYDQLKKCLKSNVNLYETSALIYNISLFVPISDVDVINNIFNKYNCYLQNEFLSFFLEKFVSSNHFWDTYDCFDITNRITALAILKDMQLRSNSHNLPLAGLDVLSDTFLKSSSIVFQVSQEEDVMRVYEIALILELISSVSSNEDYLKKLQNNKNILINAGVLLINLHRLGKESENCFTPVQKLSEFKASTQLTEHPAFGFKSDLVRLIGNLCWKNTEMQNLARTAELIPIVLDCCNMDARNPFIMQWAILAVRNLCANNCDNQKIIADLHLKGTVSSETLNEMGITLHSDEDNQLKIVPLDSIRK